MPFGGLLTAGIVSGGASILGGIFTGNAKKKAAEQQAAAFRAAAERTDKTTESVNRDLIGAGNATADQLRQAAGEAIARRDESTIQANKLLDPYRETGDQSTNLLTQGLAAGGDFNRTPTMADIQIDPGYEFRRAQAQKALEGSAAAHGGATGGGAVSQILGLNSDLASQEYQNAFERFRNTTNDRFNRLNLTAARGAQAADTQGSNLQTGAEFGSRLNYQSASDAGRINFGAAEEAGQNSIQGTRDVNDLLIGRSQAQGAGTVAQSSALWNGIQGAANIPIDVITRKNLLKNPTPGGINPTYAGNPLGNGKYGAGPQPPPRY